MSNLNNSPSLLSEALHILDKWRVEHSAQLQLLDLPDMHPRMLKRARNGEANVQEDHGLLQRIRRIFEIHNTLQTMFPHNGDMANYWVTTPNVHLQERSPLEIMITHGYDGMQTVTDQLAGQSW
ncbi:MAG: DUF2384 domain-containing protein [Halobacteria archaeon]|nr:DUF2384 domain-containing protein [Halobacteria archaeon]